MIKKSLSQLIEEIDLEEGTNEEIEERPPEQIKNELAVAKEINLIKQASEQLLADA